MHCRFNGVSPFDKRYLTNSAWKPLVIMETRSLLPPGGILLYGDASTRLMQPDDASNLVGREHIQREQRRNHAEHVVYSIVV